MLLNLIVEESYEMNWKYKRINKARYIIKQLYYKNECETCSEIGVKLVVAYLNKHKVKYKYFINGYNNIVFKII